MGYGRKNKPFVQIDIQNSGTGGTSQTSKGIEILSADPTGVDLWEGRMWIASTNVQQPSADTTAPTVTVSPNGGTFTSTQNVTLTGSDNSGVTPIIYYTLDGSTPTTSSNAYISTLTISSTSTLKYFAKDNSGNTSAIQSVTFTINTPDTTAPTVTISPAAGTFTSTQTVTLTVNEPATIYYTLDGMAPTTSSSIYSSPISISSTTTIKYFAKDTSGNQSAIQTATYTINLADTTPPNNVTNLTTGAPTSSSIPVTWTLSNSNDVANYEVAYSSNGGSTYTVASNLVNAISTSYTATGLTASTNYMIRVVAIDTYGNRSTGVTVSATTTAVVDTTPPNQVTGLTAGTVTTNSVALSWTASTSGDVDHYIIRYSSDGGSSYYTCPSTTSTSYTLTSLNPSTSYLVKVLAVDTSGNTSDFVNAPQVSATTQALPVTTLTLTTNGLLYDENFSSTSNWATPITTTTYNKSIVSGAMEIYPGTGDNYPVLLNNVPVRSDAYVVMTANMKTGNAGQDAYIIPAIRVVNSSTEWLAGKSRGGGAWGNSDYLSNDTNTGANEGALNVQNAPSRGLTDTRTIFLLAKGTNGKMKASDNANISISNITKTGGNYTGQVGFVMYSTDSTHVLRVQKYIAMTDSILQVTGQTSGQYGEILVNGTVTATATADTSGNVNFDLFGIDIPKGGLNIVSINIYTDNTKTTKVKQSGTLNGVYPGSTYSM